MSDAIACAQNIVQSRVQQFETLSRIKTPSLWFDQAAIEHNIAAMIARVGDPARWQPHIKTHKCAEIVGLCLDQGVVQFKCATLQELKSIAAIAAAKQRKVRVLCAYPFYSEQWAYARSVEQLAPGVSVTWLVDSPAHFDHLTSQIQDSSMPLRLALDVDTGMQRSGTPPQEWGQFLPAQASSPLRNGNSIETLHGYEGHLSWSEQKLAHIGYDQLIELRAICESLGFSPDLVTSGSHSYAHALSHHGLAKLGTKARVSPGTIVLNDLNSPGATRDLNLRYGALVASRVISVGQDRITLDAGSKTLSPDVQDNIASIVGHPQWRSKFQHEEHLVMEGSNTANPLKPGEIVFLVPAHVCTTVNLYPHANLVSADLETRRVDIATGHPWAQGAL